MAIARKPTKATEKDITALINKGGSTTTEKENKKTEQPIVLRIPSELLEQIDKEVSAKKIKIPRHQWLLQAIIEKLEKDGVEL